jgi:DDE superfamily endonuclease
VLVQDNLNTHTPASLYQAFSPAEARRLADRLELHYTPKHGSWLHMAEIELAMLAGQCLDRRLADRATLEREVAAWQAARNRAGRGVNWRFTTEDARIKLQHLYQQLRTDEPLAHSRRGSSTVLGTVGTAAGRACCRPAPRLVVASGANYDRRWGPWRDRLRPARGLLWGRMPRRHRYPGCVPPSLAPAP